MNVINFGLFQAELLNFPKSHQSSLDMVYGDAEPADFIDFRVAIEPSSPVRRWLRPNIVFRSDQHTPFFPLPLSQSYALLEWGLNWCIATHNFNHLLIHSAVLVKDGQAIIFPAEPGSGKSTLTTWLGLNGWEVYSDEMAVIDLQSLTVKPLYRPICVKNQSIELINSWRKDAKMTPVCHDTAKGSVAHVKVHDWATYKHFEPVPIKGVVFPKYNAAVEEDLYQITKAQLFESLCANAFNYHLLSHDGYDAMYRLVSSVDTLEIHYNDLSFLDSLLKDEILP